MDRTKLLSIAVSLVGVGPSTASAVYDQITEGRRSSPKMYYGWCGDYVTYCCMLAGVVDGEILNRQAINGEWVPGDNLARISRWAKRVGALRNYFAVPGDIIINPRSDGDHIAFILSTPNGPYRKWQTLNGNGKGGVVSIGGFPSAVRHIINVDAMPVGTYKPYGKKTKQQVVQGGGNP